MDGFMSIFNSADELIGNTPLMELAHIQKKYELKAKIFAKLEFLNATGSAKDRVAKAMIIDAENDGRLKKDSVIIEPTSGNTGIGLASVGTARGYRVIIVMPNTMSKERCTLIKAYGAEVVLSDGTKGMAGAIEKANELAQEIPNSFIPDQFSNPSNPKVHKETTGPEIWNDTNGNVDIFVAGVGTGGTITGVGEFLKSKKSDVKIVAVEPESSPLLSKGIAGSHKIQGIGANFVPSILNTNIYDEIIPVSNEDAYAMGKAIGREEGILVGISSGAALAAAIKVAQRKENEGKNIVVFFVDSGDRYLSTEMYD
jgi:cysteine synthase A